MSKLSFPYIVTYMGSTAAVASQPLTMVMEYIRGGALTALIKKNISFRFRVKVSLDVAKGMAYLHSHNIYHRDLKPDNFLIISQHDDVDVNLKITDFGTSRSNKKSKEDLQRVYGIEDTAAPSVADFSPQGNLGENSDNSKAERNLTNGVGTLIYQAPETLGGQTDYNIEKTDLYSFGVSLLHIFTGVEPYSVDPFDKFTVWDIINFVTRGDRLDTAQVEDYRIRNMIVNCWQDKPDKRPKFSLVARELADILDSPGPQATPSSPVVTQHSPKAMTNSASALYSIAPEPSSPKQITHGASSFNLSPPASQTKPPSQPASPRESFSAIPTAVPEKKGMVVPLHAEQLCWCGNIDRRDADKLLAPNVLPGTFLTRWSDNIESYVLTYKKPSGGLEHIAHIIPAGDHKVVVKKSDGSTTPYESLLKYIETLREERVITQPYAVAAEPAPTGDLYSFSS